MSPCFALISSVPLWGRPPRKHRGQCGSGQPEKLHLLLQASQSCLSTSSRYHGAPRARPTPPSLARNAESSYQAVSTRVPPPQAGDCVETSCQVFVNKKKKPKKLSWLKIHTFYKAAPSHLLKGPVCMIILNTPPPPSNLTCSPPFVQLYQTVISQCVYYRKCFWMLAWERILASGLQIKGEAVA